MHRKRKVLLSIGVIAACLIAAGSFCLYHSFHPNIMFARMVKDSDVRFEEEYYCESLMMITAESTMIPIASSVEDKIEEFHIWNNDVVTDLYENYVAPLHITVSGAVNGGKTTFWYEGYATTPEGDTVKYREKETFDYIFVPGDELLQSNTAKLLAGC